jgi:hypothetical protein
MWFCVVAHPPAVLPGDWATSGIGKATVPALASTALGGNGAVDLFVAGLILGENRFSGELGPSAERVMDVGCVPTISPHS